jgi:hypothetical protein
VFSWIIDQIPFGVWVVLTLGVAGALFYFLSPILIPLWAVTPRPIKIGLGFVISIALAILYGRSKGAQDAREMQKAKEAQAIENRRKINADVADDTDDELHRRTKRWMRDD